MDTDTTARSDLDALTALNPYGQNIGPRSFVCSMVNSICLGLSSIGRLVAFGPRSAAGPPALSNFSGIANWAVKDWARRMDRQSAESEFEPFTWFLYERGQKMSSGDYPLIVQDMQRHTRDICCFFERFDVMLTPTKMIPPPPLGYLNADKDTILKAAKRMMSYTFFCFIANGAGLPSASLPLHWNEDGLPIGFWRPGELDAKDCSSRWQVKSRERCHGRPRRLRYPRCLR